MDIHASSHSGPDQDTGRQARQGALVRARPRTYDASDPIAGTIDNGVTAVENICRARGAYGSRAARHPAARCRRR